MVCPMRGSPDASSGLEAVSRTLFVSPGAIRCWSVELGVAEEWLEPLAGVLAPDERERAIRFLFPRDRHRFVVARASLRVLLGRHLGARPSAIGFTYGPQGKPSLAGSTGASLHFSVSHCEDLALIVLRRDGPLGVDLEAVRPMADRDAVASRFFTAAETAAIDSVPPAARDLAFFLCWTRKEAFAKAMGAGLSFALDRCQVTCRPDEPPRVVEIDGDRAEGARWFMWDLRPAPGFVGAVAVRASGPSTSLARLSLEADVLPFVAT